MTALAAVELSQIPMSQALAATLARASDAAGATGAEEVGLEHLLNALCDDPDALGVLNSSHVDIFRLKAETADYVMRAARGAPGGPRALSVAPALRRILEAAAAAARGGRRRDINGAIVLAAIIGDGKSVAAQMLQAQGLTFEAAIKALQSALAQTAREEAPAAAEDVLARARERVQSRSAPSLRDIMHDRPRPAAPPPPPSIPGGPRHEAPPVTGQSAVLRDATIEEEEDEEQEVLTTPVEASRRAPEPVPAAAEGPPAQRHWEPIPSATSAPPQWESVPAAMPPPAQAPYAPPVSASPPAPSAAPAAAMPAPHEPEAPRAPQAPPKPSPSQNAAAQPPPYAAPSPVLPPAPPVAMQPGPARSAAAPSREGGYVYPSAQPIQRAPEPSPAVPSPRSMTLDATGGGPAMPPPIPPPIPRAPTTPGGGAPALSKMAAPSISVHGPGAAPSQNHGPNLNAPTRGEGPGSMLAPIPASQASPQMRREPAGKAEIGQLAENIPRAMRVGLSERVEIRIAKAHVKTLTEGLEGGGLAWKHEVTVTQAMSVRLRAPQGGFFIETASPETQWVENQVMAAGDDYASWRFMVTPQRRGWASLQIIVSARTVGADGLAAETALPDQVVEVKVKTNMKRMLLRWSGWAAAAVAGGLLSKFGEGFFEAGKQIVQKFIT